MKGGERTVELQQRMFEAAISPYAQGLFAFIRCQSPPEPEDVYQETMLAAWQGFERYRHRAGMKTWLYAIARNKCLDALRRKYRQPPTAPREAGEDAAGQRFEQAADERMDLHNALAALREEDRSLLYLIYAQGFTVQEAAEAMDIPEGTVKSRLYTLRRRLRERMEGP